MLPDASILEQLRDHDVAKSFSLKVPTLLVTIQLYHLMICNSLVFGISLHLFIHSIFFSNYPHFSVKSITIGKDLQSHANALWGLLPAFCRHPNDTYQNFGPLAEVFVTFLKEDSFMHENVAVALQVISCLSEIITFEFDACLCSVEFLLLFHVLFLLFLSWLA